MPDPPRILLRTQGEPAGTVSSDSVHPVTKDPSDSAPVSPAPSTAIVGLDVPVDKTSTTAISQSKQPAAPRPENRNHPEWFARIRIREDRLARLWVTNLAGRDVVVWSAKEKRWVAMLAIPELRRSIEVAESRLPEHKRSACGQQSGALRGSLSRPPDSLPPAPPPAFSKLTGQTVGELRLQSILGQSRSNDEVSRAGMSPLSLQPAAVPSSKSRRRRGGQPRLGTLRGLPQSNTSRRWHWRAVERALWMAAGVLAVFVLSGTGSADEKPTHAAPPALILAADYLDPAWSELSPGSKMPSLGESLLGPPQQCVVRPHQCPPNGAADTAIREDTSSRETASGTPARPQADPTPRTQQASAPQRPSKNQTEQPAETPADLNFTAIRAALFNAAALARTCPGKSVAGKAVITFEPSGSVRSVDLPLLIGDDPDRACILRSFKSIRVPPFSGGAVAVKKDF